MLLMILLAVGTGLFWILVGILLSRMNASGASMFAFFTSGAFIGMIGCVAIMFGSTVATGKPLFDPTIKPALGGIIFWQGLSGLVNPIGMICLVAAMRKGHQGLVWAISQVAMAIPFLTSVIIWREEVRLWGWLGVAFVITAIALISRNKKTQDPQTDKPAQRGWLLLALASFVLIGISQVLMSIPSRWEGWVDTPGLRQGIIFAGNVIVFGIFWGFRKGRLGRTSLLAGLSWALIAIVSMLMLYKSLDLAGKMSLTGVVFPCVVGTCISGFSLYSWLRLKEKYSALALAGVALCVLGVVLIGLA